MTKIDVTFRTLTDTNARDVRRGRQHCLKLALASAGQPVLSMTRRLAFGAIGLDWTRAPFRATGVAASLQVFSAKNIL